MEKRRRMAQWYFEELYEKKNVIILFFPALERDWRAYAPGQIHSERQGWLRRAERGMDCAVNCVLFTAWDVVGWFWRAGRAPERVGHANLFVTKERKGFSLCGNRCQEEEAVEEPTTINCCNVLMMLSSWESTKVKRESAGGKEYHQEALLSRNGFIYMPNCLTVHHVSSLKSWTEAHSILQSSHRYIAIKGILLGF